MVTDHPRSSSRHLTMALCEGEPSAVRAGFGTSRKCFRTPRTLETRTSVCWSAQSAPSTFVAALPPRSRGCKLLCSHWDQRISSRKLRWRFLFQSSSASQCATCGKAGKSRLLSSSNVPRSASQSVHSQCSKEVKNVRCVFGQRRIMAKALRQQIVEFGGSTTIFGVQLCYCVPSRVVFHRSSSGGTGTSLRRRSSIVSPILSEWLCAKHLERDALEMGDPLIVDGAHSTSRCRWCEDPGDVRSNMRWLKKNGKRERGRYGMRVVESAKPPTQGLSPRRVAGEVLCDVRGCFDRSGI